MKETEMKEVVDARRLSCPQPVVLTQKKMNEKGKGVIEVLVDTNTSKENVTRLAQQLGWKVDVIPLGEDYCLVLGKDK